MTTITKKDTSNTLTLMASGHAGYGPMGADIVCAACSMLIYTLKQALQQADLLLDAEFTGGEGKVVGRKCVRSEHIFETVLAGYALLMQNYPAHVEVVG